MGESKIVCEFEMEPLKLRDAFDCMFLPIFFKDKNNMVNVIILCSSEEDNGDMSYDMWINSIDMDKFIREVEEIENTMKNILNDSGVQDTESDDVIEYMYEIMNSFTFKNEPDATWLIKNSPLYDTKSGFISLIKDELSVYKHVDLENLDFLDSMILDRVPDTEYFSEVLKRLKENNIAILSF